MSEQDLYKLFTSLQKAGFPLGINDYKLLLEAVAQKEELGIENRKALKRFCCALWVKSPADKLRFDAHFDRIISDTEGQKDDSQIKKAPVQKSKECLALAAVLGNIILLGIGGLLTEQGSSPQPEKTPPNSTKSSTTSPKKPAINPVFPTKFPRTVILQPTTTPQPTTPETEEDWLDEIIYLILLIGAIAAAKWLLEQKQKKRPNFLPLSQKSQIIATLPTQLTPDYFPFSARQMKQTWRYWRCLIPSGIPRDLDVEATIRSISRQGFLLEPILRQRRINRTQLLLLLDVQGSMLPFHDLCHQLAQTALEGGRFHQTLIYYFYNCPQNYLYQDPYRKEPVTLDVVLRQLQPRYAGVLIVSDGEPLEETITKSDRK